MARIRSIKPEFFTSETVASLDRGARLTFVGLWTYVDDNGVGIYNEMLIAAALYPLDDPSEAVRWVREDLRSLSGVALVRLYQRDRKRFVAITNFAEHQKPSHPRQPRYPRPSDEGCEPLTCDGRAAPEDRARDSGVAPGSLQSGSVLSREQGAGSVPAEDVREDVEKVCGRLASRMVENGNRPPTISKQWRSSARLLLDRDERPLDEVLRVIDWSQRDEFWRTNVLSLPKLREKYDQLRLQAQRGNVRSLPRASGQPIDLDSVPPSERWMYTS